MNILEEIKQITESVTEIDDISKKTNKGHYVESRSIYYTVSREFTKYSSAVIGKVVDVDHATVFHGLKRFKTYAYKSDSFNRDYKLIKEAVKHLKASYNDKNRESATDDVTSPLIESKLHTKYALLNENYKIVLDKQTSDRKRLIKLLKAEKTSDRLVDITEHLTAKQIDQMIDRMEQFSKMCKYHNEKKKVL